MNAERKAFTQNLVRQKTKIINEEDKSEKNKDTYQTIQLKKTDTMKTKKQWLHEFDIRIELTEKNGYGDEINNYNTNKNFKYNNKSITIIRINMKYCDDGKNKVIFKRKA